MDAFTAIADPTRRQIVIALATGEQSFGELAERFEMSRPAVSQHLKVLREAGVVDERQVGRQRLYRLNPEGIRAARAAIEVFLVNELDDLETSARQLSKRRITDG